MYKNKGGVQMKVREEEQMNKCMADRIMDDERGEIMEMQTILRCTLYGLWKIPLEEYMNA